MLGANVVNFIPNRLVDGYGFTEGALGHCIHLHQPSLIVTVDCGINAVSTTLKAHEMGIDVIITDHHEPDVTIAPALAVVNPKLGNGNPNMLAGVGVAYQLCRGVANTLQKATNSKELLEVRIQPLLDIVAIGTIADMVPLKGDNRILAYNGLIRASDSVNLGIRALVAKIGLGQRISSQDISFKIAPRINAVGRLGDPKEALQLFTTNSPSEATFLADRLEALNLERRTIEKEVTNDVLATLRKTFKLNVDYGLVSVGYGYHAGIVGIVAAKVMNYYNRPSIVLNVSDNGIASGSCRSIPHFNILEALADSKDLLISYGGHAFAAGVKLKVENVDAFRQRFNAYAKSKLVDLDITPTIEISSEVKPNDLSWDFFNQLQELAPFGKDNAEPIWCLQNINISKQRMINNTHLAFSVDTCGESVSGICFNYVGKPLPDTVDVAFTLNRNVFLSKKLNPPQPIETLQLMVVDIKPALASKDKFIIDETFLDAHPEAIFVFGDNTQGKGTAGAAKLRGHKQALGFITKKFPSNTDTSFYQPEEYQHVFNAEVFGLVDFIKNNPNSIFYISKLGSNLANRYNIWEKIIEPQLPEKLAPYKSQVVFLWD